MADLADEGQRIAAQLRRHEIVPLKNPTKDSVWQFYVEAGRDFLEIAHELSFFCGLHSAEFIPIAAEKFKKQWEAFSGTLDGDSCAPSGSKEIVGIEQSTIGRLLCDIFFCAVNAAASDIHFESLGDGLLVRMRVDGTLRTKVRLPAEMLQPFSILLKTLAKLDIAERLAPQDGRFGLTVAGAPIDFRISVLPTKLGESIVLRVLDRRRLFRGLDDLTMDDGVRAELRSSIGAPSGMLIVSGPTGSGKTTTLYAAIGELQRDEIKVLTIEDPIEYELQNCMQASVDLPLGRTFSSVLRAFLRHDPDKIFVGEIRDGETAQIALRAALTGHLVLTTLHTATAAEAILRLVEMGLEKSLLLSCLRGILSQRLLRLNCRHCSKEWTADGNLPEKLERLRGKTMRRGIGCKHCGGSGYAGRKAFFEFLHFGDKGGSGLESLPSEMNSLAQSGLEAVEGGEISLEEFMQQMPWNR
ncbi:MAG: GspE/PulE family protein [Puniceicoccales bacterium]|nr:GspE/PulE family protein [Puniceicoccales bacterium]